MSTLDILGSGLAATEGPGLADFNTRGGFFFSPLSTPFSIVPIS